jgi:hypothetical protein
MPFEADIFISYAHQDNKPSPGQPGWVSQLEEALKAFLARVYYRDPVIWRDPRLAGYEDFDQSIRRKLLGSAVLVCVVSPRYVESDYCKLELNEFYQTTRDDQRLFKVVTFGLPEHQKHPPPLNKQNGYLFFTANPETGQVYELNPFDNGTLYRQVVQDLARHIAGRLAEIEGKSRPRAEPPTVIYLAETSVDLRERREQLRRELELHGYEVLPDRPLPPVFPECAGFIREQLRRASLSVHLIGKYRGGVPDGPTDDSYVELQNELAIERGPQNFRRLIWMPPGLASEDRDHQRFLENLRADPRTYQNADLFERPFDEFAAEVLRKAQPREQPPQSPARQPGQPKRIYVVCDQRDLEAVRPLEEFLYNRGHEVVLPLFDASEQEMRSDQTLNLTTADAILIYYGLGGAAWQRQKLIELRQSAFGRPKEIPLLARALYVAPPPTPEKERLRTLEALLVRQEGGFSPDVLQNFLAAVEGAGAGG